MPIEYDPDVRPELTMEMLLDAQDWGLHPVHILCDEPDAAVGDESGVSFWALVASVPRQGDRIDLEDGGTCEVQRVAFKVSCKRDGTGKIASIILIPNVYAVRCDRKA